MLLGKKLGILSSFFGISVGAYYSVSSVLSNPLLSGQSLGLQIAIIAIVAGLSFFTIGIMSNKQIKA